MMTAPIAPQPLWRLEVTVPKHAVAAFEGVFEGVSVAVTSMGDDDIPWRVEGYTDCEPDTAAIEAGQATYRSVQENVLQKIEPENARRRDLAPARQTRQTTSDRKRKREKL